MVKKIDDKVTVGLEMTGAVTRNTLLERNQFQVTLGGSYALHDGFSLDAGFIVGHFEASPRLGVQLGFSWDLNAEPPNQSPP